MNWYGDDWEHLGGYLTWLAERVKDATLKEAIERAARNDFQIAFLDYDWSLNSQAASQTAAVSPPQKGAEFGSGSVPNE